MRFPHPSTPRPSPAERRARMFREQAAAWVALWQALRQLPPSCVMVPGCLLAVLLLGAYVRTVLSLVRAGEEFRIHQVAEARAGGPLKARLSAASDKRSAAPLMVAAAGKVESSHKGS